MIHRCKDGIGSLSMSKMTYTTRGVKMSQVEAGE